MEMVKEEYINKDMMGLLLEKGCPIDKVFVQDFRPVWYTKDYNDPKWQDCDAYYIPTQSQVMKWLRDVGYLITVTIIRDGNDSQCLSYNIYKMNKEDKELEIIFNNYFPEFSIDSYKETIDAAIKYVLENLIKK